MLKNPVNNSEDEIMKVVNNIRNLEFSDIQQIKRGDDKQDALLEAPKNKENNDPDFYFRVRRHLNFELVFR